jgi:hypothetical protein
MLLTIKAQGVEGAGGNQRFLALFRLELLTVDRMTTPEVVLVQIPDPGRAEIGFVEGPEIDVVGRSRSLQQLLCGQDGKDGI